MLGDFINFIKLFWLQHFKCQHDYDIKVRTTIMKVYELKECKICGRTKVKEI